MFELKTLSEEAIRAALEKAERYRFLNEPGEAESICLDVLKIAPENQQALVTLLLAVSDRMEKCYGVGDSKAKEILGKLKGEYERAYYSGILCERRAKMRLSQGAHGRVYAYDLFREAMEYYEKAETMRPPGNDDALLRWNTCARIIARNDLVARDDEKLEQPLE